MANLKDIKNRIQSVESTKKITRAMKMVAAAKVKRAESTVKMSRPFTEELNKMFKKLLASVGAYSNTTLKIKSAIDNYPALLQTRETKTAGILVITSNKGLAGAYNGNIIKKTVQTVKLSPRFFTPDWLELELRITSIESSEDMRFFTARSSLAMNTEFLKARRLLMDRFRKRAWNRTRKRADAL